MAMGGGIMDYVQRFQNLQLHRDTGDELIKDLLLYTERVESGLRAENQQLLSRLRDQELDLDDARKSRREFQQQLQQLESTNGLLLQDNNHLKSFNPYVVVLIDGDGLLFKETFIRQGLEGGKRAAYALRTAILSQCGDFANNIEVVAKVYANLAGLSKAMRRDGTLDSESDLRDFTLGFTQGKATFDFIDVGYGKERADNKIKGEVSFESRSVPSLMVRAEQTKWNLRNINCKHLILGISHDAGYAPFLDELFQDHQTSSRITVLEGFLTVRELTSTGVSILNLNDTLFRSEKLVDRVCIIRDPTPPAASVGVIGAPIPKPTTTSNSSSSAVTATSSVKSPAASATSTPSTAPATTWAAKAVGGNASPPPQITLPLQPKPVTTPVRAAQAKPTPPPWNPGARGLDTPIQVSQSALDNIKKRKDSNKLCNNHYLRGPCAKGDACVFEHKYKPTKDEITAIAFLARLNPCTNGQDCEVKDCIYGHHCPSVRDGVCTHPYCKFETEDHPPNTKFRTKSHEY
ncbi:hypothetical protein B0H63DRAFT_521729 [Podospora didyma]|uniref:C3H1-type domain-containing protein n=1 Tax=Podospora didyma TaxID=330526 RepID=A0AAE0U212_9PEZI|nr:hypothetical protein B0H63DRAFT_521729 [Podospora didyma]